MKVEEAIFERVNSLDAVEDIVGENVWLDKLPQSAAMPAVRIVLIDDVESYQLRGPAGVAQARVQVDAFAREDSGVDPYAQATALADAINGDGKGVDATGLSGWIGSVGSPGIRVLGCFVVDRRRAYDPDELRIVTVSQDYMVTWKST